MRILALLFGIGLVAGVAVAVAVTTAPAQPTAAPAQEPREEDATAQHTEAPEPACVPGMPLEERAAVVLVVGLPEVVSPEDPLVTELGQIGVGGVFLTGYNVAGREAFTDLVDGLRAAAPRPLLVTTDEELGRVSSFRSLLGSTSSPRTLATRLTPEEMEATAEQLGRDLADLGVDLDFAPVADLDDGPAQSIIGDRSFSADPQVATDHTLAFARGLVSGGVVPTIKHFPGHGRVSDDTHSDGAVDETPLAELRRTDLVPFVEAIDAGAPLIMTGHVTHTALDDELPASVAPATYELLRELGFSGVAITDSVGMGAVHRRWKFPDSAPLAVAAGADAVLATDGRQAQAMRGGIIRAVQAGDLPEERLNEAAARMLTLVGVDPEPATCVAVEDFPTEMLPEGTGVPRHADWEAATAAAGAGS